MIKSLEIHNVQSHKDTFLEFDPGVNIIIGSSDSGKTAILRAIKKVVLNRPLGDSFISNWAKEYFIRITTSEDTITRSKDREEKYQLNKTSFTAFKTEVPIEIIKALNISDINLQQQLDQPFLLTETPGAVASHFNKVANLDQIDLAQSNIKKWVNTLNSEITHKTTDISNKEEELVSFDYLEKFEINIEVLEEKEKQRITLQNNYNKLLVKIDDLDEITTLIEKEEQILTLEPLLSKVLKDIEHKEELKDTCVDLIHFLHEIEKVEVELDMLSELLSIEEPLLELLTRYEEKKELIKQSGPLSRLIQSIKTTDADLYDTQLDYEELHTKFEKEFPDECPLCNKPK